MCDAGSSAHTTPRLLDLEQKYEDGNSLVEKQPSFLIRLNTYYYRDPNSSTHDDNNVLTFHIEIYLLW
jgi:hypothetical protein